MVALGPTLEAGGARRGEPVPRPAGSGEAYQQFGAEAVSGQIRILIADDRAATREGTRRVLRMHPGIEVIAEAANGIEAVELTKALRPDVLLLDIQMPLLDGMQVAALLRWAAPETRIIALTGHEGEQFADALARLGVSGYLSKAASHRELAAAIRTVHAGRTHFQMAFADALFAPARKAAGDAPTSQELEVLRRVAQGARNLEIAKLLSTSERTVQYHLGNLFSKLRASSRTEMVVLARQKGWIV